MQRVTGINQEATNRLLAEALPLLTQAAREFAVQVRVFVTACRSGKANHKTSLVRIPDFVFKDSVNFCGKGMIGGGPAFAAYYLAHRLAHVKAATGTHNSRFMEAFRRCVRQNCNGTRRFTNRNVQRRRALSLPRDGEDNDATRI